MTDVTTVEIVDDQFLFAQALASVVADEPGFEIVGIAVTGPQALAIASERRPAVILLDYHLPGADADALIPKIRERSAESRIIVLTSDTTDSTRRKVDALADAFLTKETAIEDVIDAIRRVVGGGGPAAARASAVPAPPSRPAPTPAPGPGSSSLLATAARLEGLDAAALLTLRGGTRAWTAHNLPADGTWRAEAARLVDQTIAQRAINHLAAFATPLADGRTSRSALAVPALVGGEVAGVLLALRAAAPFARADATPLSDAAKALIAAAPAPAAAEPAVDPRVVVDVAAAIGRDEPADLVLALIAKRLGTRRAALFVREPDDRLRCAAALGYGAVPEPLGVASDSRLVRVILGGRVELLEGTEALEAAWVGGAGAALLTPIAAGGAVRGMLVLGRTERGFSPAEQALAESIAEELVPLTARARRPAAPAPPPPAPAPSAPAASTHSDEALVPARARAAASLAATPRKKRSGFWGALFLLVLAAAVAFAGYVSLGPLAYLAAAVLLLVALFSAR